MNVEQKMWHDFTGFLWCYPIYRDTFEQIDAMPKIIRHAREEAKIIPNIHDMQKMI